MANILISVKNLSKTFNLTKKQMKINQTNNSRKVAVNDLSFNLFEGEIYGLLGPNGAGKTTTMRILATLIKPDGGVITVNGYDVVKDACAVRNSLAFLTSDLKLDDFFTPNYLFFFYGRLKNMNDAQINARKELLFDKFAINSYAEVKIGDLSTGMKQKVALAISLVSDPKIIIYDEPTNGLDVLTAKLVTDFLIEMKNEGKSIIVSTHIFSLIEKVCDRVGIIFDGEMKFEDSLTNIMNKSTLEDLFFNLYNGDIN